MSKHRFRYSKDFDVPASSADDARTVLKEICASNGIVDLQQALERGQFEYLGDAEVQDISEEDRARAKMFAQAGMLLMSCQYRGENFTVLCTSRDVNETHKAVRPLALLLREEQLDNLTDPTGGRPVLVEKELNHEQETAD